MIWADWKRTIRKQLDADPDFDLETSDIAFFDIVDGEPFAVTRHTVNENTIVGLMSSKEPE